MRDWRWTSKSSSRLNKKSGTGREKRRHRMLGEHAATTAIFGSTPVKLPLLSGVHVSFSIKIRPGEGLQLIHSGEDNNVTNSKQHSGLCLLRQTDSAPVAMRQH